MAGLRRASQKLADQIVFIACRRLGVAIGCQIWTDVVRHWESATTRRESNHIRNKIGRSTKIEVVVGLVFGLRLELRRTLVERHGRHGEFIAAVENVLVHLSRLRRARRRERLPTSTRTRRCGVKWIERSDCASR